MKAMVSRSVIVMSYALHTSSGYCRSTGAWFPSRLISSTNDTQEDTMLPPKNMPKNAPMRSPDVDCMPKNAMSASNDKLSTIWTRSTGGCMRHHTDIASIQAESAERKERKTQDGCGICHAISLATLRRVNSLVMSIP